MDDDEDLAASKNTDGSNKAKPFQESYPSMVEAREAIKDYLQSRGMPYFARKASREFYTLACPKMKLDPPVDCDFNVTANFQKKTGRVKVIKCRLDHTCGIMLEGSKHVKVEAGWVCRKAEPFLKEQPNATAADLSQHMKKRFGVDVAYKLAWKVKQKFDKSLSTSEETAFQLIQPYFAKLEQRMPGTITVLERDSEQRLVRTFVLLKPLADALPSCRPVLSFDVCDLKSTFKGVLMAATMVDGTGQTLPLAWGTAQMEDTDNWNWFAQNLIHSLPYLQDHSFTIFSDMGKGLEEAVETHFPQSFHSYCVKYIEKRLADKFRYKSDAVMKASKQLDSTKFEQAMTTIEHENKKAHGFLRRIPVERWTTCHATYPKWGVVTLNAYETLKGWMEDFSDISHIGLHTGLVRKCTQVLYDRRTLYDGTSTPFPRPILQQLEANVRTGRTLDVVQSSLSLFTVGAGAEVDLTGPSCTCMSYVQTGLPCKHMAAVGNDITGWVHPSYTIRSLKAMYAGIIPPCTVDSTVVPDNVTKPPTVHRPPPGRPKRRRSRSSIAPEASPIVCSRCQERGHNSRTCEWRHQEEEEEDDEES